MIPEQRSFTAAQAFLLEAKTYWTREIYPALRGEYEAANRRQAAAADGRAGGMKRHLRRMKYSGRYGLHPYHAQRRGHLEAALQDTKVEVKPAFRYPDYYTSVDIHQHPGGVWAIPSPASSTSTARAAPRRSPPGATRTCTSA